MAGDRELKVKILGDASGALREFDKVGKASDDMGGKIGGHSKVLAGIAVGAGVAALGIAKGALEAVGESEKVAAQTEAVIRSTGGAANVSTAQIGELSHSLQTLSGVTDENIQAGANMLLTFTNVKNGVGQGNDIFDQATKTALDMSVALGTDVKDSALQLGKAINDPIKGVTALQRVGVTFTAAQKEQIKTLVASGDVMGAQKIILKELNTEFGGSAKAAGDALSPTEKLSLRWGDMQEKIGAKLVPAMQKLSDIGIKVIDFIDHLSPGVQQALGVVAALAATVFVVVKAVQAWTAVQAALNVVMALNPIVLVALAIAGLVAGVVLAYHHFEGFRNVVDTVWQALQSAFDWVSRNWPLILAILTGPFGLAAKYIFDHWDGIVGFIKGLPGKIAGAASGMWDGIKNAFRSAINWIIGAWNRLEFKIPGFDPPGPGPKFGGFTLGVPDIPKLALGGIVKASPGGTLALLGEGGRDEAVIPLGAGGPVEANRAYLVGEEGPELFMPSSGGAIVPTASTRGLSGLGSTIVQLNASFPNYVGDRGDLARWLEDWLRTGSGLRLLETEMIRAQNRNGRQFGSAS